MIDLQQLTSTLISSRPAPHPLDPVPTTGQSNKQPSNLTPLANTPFLQRLDILTALSWSYLSDWSQLLYMLIMSTNVGHAVAQGYWTNTIFPKYTTFS